MTNLLKTLCKEQNLVFFFFAFFFWVQTILLIHVKANEAPKPHHGLPPTVSCNIKPTIFQTDRIPDQYYTS